MINCKRQRKSIRLPEYDYSKNGWYFVTICSQNRELYFKNNNVKQIIDNQWQKLKNKFDYIDLDEYVIMPNHLHGIVIITHRCCRGGVSTPICKGEVTSPLQNGVISPLQKPTLGQIIAYFKYQSTKYINIVLKNPPGQQLWQRNYYEHIIRNEKSLQQIREYIQLNPSKWEEDKNNPKNFEINYVKTNPA